MSSTILAISSLAALANGNLIYTYAYEAPLYESPLYAYEHARSWVDTNSMTRSSWRMSPEHYSVKIQTPAVEHGSVTASLSPDGTMLNVNAKRRIEGCQCQESTVGQVGLPHTPRAEDIDVTHDPSTGVVSVKIARHAKADEPTPLSIKTLEPEVEPKQEARPLRFVPHESASSKQHDEPVETAEKQLLDKFKALAAKPTDTNQAETDKKETQ